MQNSSSSRQHYVDALRVFAMALVVPWHAANFFAIRGRGGMPLAGGIWISHVFRMPLFFLIAGFFGAMVANRRGSLGWMRGRLVRLGIPLVVGVAVLTPLTGLLAAWQGGEVQAGSHPLVTELINPKPAYLWFLWYLLIMLHDVGGLAALRDVSTPVRIVVIDNDGGGIFSFLPQAEALPSGEYEALLGTPRGVDVGKTADLFGLPHRRLASFSELPDALAAGTGLIEVGVGRHTNVDIHRRLSERVRDTLGPSAER